MGSFRLLTVLDVSVAFNAIHPSIFLDLLYDMRLEVSYDGFGHF